ncbi:Dual specificity protein phosphatase 22 [Trichinella patagoniensis]|uniref:Dual specificity protein phosphatase 22 n=1 Tax=Trichinella patagoniensis TaxID=990121 RepID=A0A0V0ZQQ7_9BILA|nr:Dual specificity protein phosphatase 22 [Trichinella patagoniensis]KRY14802.1 Dual specificity protein phosphatase 22 [Trichinella patagoniensis]
MGLPCTLGLVATAALVGGCGIYIVYRSLNAKLSLMSHHMQLEVDNLRKELRELQSTVGEEHKQIKETIAQQTGEIYYDAISNDKLLDGSTASEATEELEEDEIKSIFNRVEKLISTGIEDRYEVAYRFMNRYYDRFSDNLSFILKMLEVSQSYATSFPSRKEEIRKDILILAKERAFAALKQWPNDAQLKKCCAIALAERILYVTTTKDRIEEGVRLKSLLDESLAIFPDDEILNYLNGRWLFYASGINCLERYYAAAFYKKLPSASYDTAFRAFKKSDEVSTGRCAKSTKLYLAKTSMELGRMDEAHKYVDEGILLTVTSKDDEEHHDELMKLKKKLENCHDRPVERQSHRQHLILKVSDSSNENIIKHVSTVNDFIHRARLDGGVVLIHCMMGVSRSVSLSMAYIMSVTDLGWRDALNVIRSARRQANPNFHFRRQLHFFENTDLAAERQRMDSLFTNAGNLRKCDMKKCQQALESYNRWVEFGDRLKDEQESLVIDRLNSSGNPEQFFL